MEDDAVERVKQYGKVVLCVEIQPHVGNGASVLVTEVEQVCTVSVMMLNDNDCAVVSAAT